MYNTGNPLGSTAPKDFSDNSEITDRYVNDVVNETTQDRFGRSRLTIHGQQEKARRSFEQFESDADNVIANLGFFPPVDYTTGLTVDSRNFTVTYNGIIYAAQPSAVPFTTGAWDAAQWYPIQNLLNQKNLLVFDTYAEASAAAATLPDGQMVDVLDMQKRYDVQSGALFFVEKLNHLDIVNIDSFSGTNAERVEAAAAFASSNGKMLFLNESIELERPITFAEDLAIICGPLQKFTNGYQSSQVMITFGGKGFTDLPTLASSVSAGGSELIFSAAHNLTAGDVIAICNPANGSWNAARDYYKAGEFCVVSKVIDAQTVSLANPLYDSYTSSGVVLGKMNASRFRFVGQFKAELTLSSNTGVCTYLQNVVDTDVSGFDIKANGRAQIALGFIHCLNVIGFGVSGEQNASTSLNTTDYGIYCCHSQGVKLYASRGRGRRHGFTTSGSGAYAFNVPNRDCVFDGVWSNYISFADNTPVQAGDFHGNTEYCTMSGEFMGGISPAGDKNKYRGVSRAGANGIVLYASELLGLNQDFSGMSFIANNDVIPSISDSGAISFRNSAATTNTKRGGKIDFSKTNINIKNSGLLVGSFNLAAITAPDASGSIDFTDSYFEGIPNAATSCIVITNSSGTKLRKIDFLGAEHSGSSSVLIVNGPLVPYYINPKMKGVLEFTGDGTTLMTLTFDMPNATKANSLWPSVQIASVGSYKRIHWQLRDMNSTRFRIYFAKDDGSVISSSESFTAYWEA